MDGLVDEWSFIFTHLLRRCYRKWTVLTEETPIGFGKKQIRFLEDFLKVFFFFCAKAADRFRFSCCILKLKGFWFRNVQFKKESQWSRERKCSIRAGKIIIIPNNHLIVIVW